MNQMPKRVLILCTGNSCRSQMAEGLWRMLGKNKWECFSAGSKPAGYVHPMAINVMQEIGIDLSQNRSKHVDEYAGQSFDLVVTVGCNRARSSPGSCILAADFKVLPRLPLLRTWNRPQCRLFAVGKYRYRA
jgi:protein-tyrosine-phosphatase